MLPVEKILGLPEQGYFLQPVSDSSVSDAHHRLGATPDTDFPECPVCEVPLQTLLALNTKDLRLKLGKIPRKELELLICPHHLTRELQYTVTSAGEVLLSELIHVPEMAGDAHLTVVLPGPRQIMFHAIPDRIAETRELAGEGRLPEAADWARKFDWNHPQNQVGGNPVLINRQLTAPVCSLCDSKMPFLASIVVGVTSPLEPDTRTLQMLYFLCRGCSNVAVKPDLAVPDYS